MKKFLHICWITAAAVVSVPLMLYVLWLGLIIVPCLLFGGGAYWRSGEKALYRIGGRMCRLDIYKAPDKPFLLVGPCRFSKDETDFFFVNRRQVVRTATDKGGSWWVCVLNRLFILDDLTGGDPLRLPYWDELRRRGSSVTDACGRRIYAFPGASPGETAVLAVPLALLTPDMDTADNFTLRH